MCLSRHSPLHVEHEWCSSDVIWGLCVFRKTLTLRPGTATLWAAAWRSQIHPLWGPAAPPAAFTPATRYTLSNTHTTHLINRLSSHARWLSFQTVTHELISFCVCSPVEAWWVCSARGISEQWRWVAASNSHWFTMARRRSCTSKCTAARTSLRCARAAPTRKWQRVHLVLLPQFHLQNQVKDISVLVCSIDT